MNPNDLRYTKSHEWISADGTAGVTDHAQHEITDVVFVELPKVGRVCKSAEACCVVESVKAAFDIYTPVSGEIISINTDLSGNPGLVNQSPYEAGWLYKMKISDDSEREKLMTYEQYQEFLKSN